MLYLGIISLGGYIGKCPTRSSVVYPILTPDNQSCFQNVVLSSLSKYDHQFHVEVYSLRGGPTKEDQHEVLEEACHDATQGRDGGDLSSDQEDDVQAHERKAEIDKQFSVLSGAKLPVGVQ